MRKYEKDSGIMLVWDNAKLRRILQDDIWKYKGKRRKRKISVALEKDSAKIREGY